MTKAKAKGGKRTYGASDFKELMDNTGGWAHSWDDVLKYLRGPAVYDADFAKDEIPGMIQDVEGLKDRDIPFTTDYRVIWSALTKEDTSELPPLKGIKKPPTNPMELEGKYLKGLHFPASKSQVLDCAKENHAPARVLEVLLRLKDKRYRNMGSLIESVGDLTWDHD